MKRTERAPPLFKLTVLITIGLAGLIGLMVLMMQLQPGFMGMAHFTERHHRIHDITFGLLNATAAVGMLAQLRTPSTNVAGQLMALIPWGALGLIAILTSTPIRFAPFPLFAGLTLLATVLHPRRRELFRVFSASRVNWVMVVLVIILAISFLPVTSRNISLQRNLTNDHATLGHYGFMAAFCITVPAVGFLASLRPDGWRFPAWTAGLLPVLLGVASLMYSGVDSSLGPSWSLAAIAWGLVYVASAEWGRGSQLERRYETGVQAEREETAATPRWVYPIALVAVVLVLAIIIALHVTGGGLRGHTTH